MNHVDADQLADVIEANWPHPPLTDIDRGVLARALHDVSWDDAMRAVDRLVADGREFQPRAPHILACLRVLRTEHRRALPARTDTLPPYDPSTPDRLRGLVARLRGGMTPE